MGLRRRLNSTLLAAAVAAAAFAAPTHAQIQPEQSPPPRTPADTAPPTTNPTAPPAPPAPAPNVPGDLQRLSSILGNPTARQLELDLAAAQLVSRESPTADAILHDVLASGTREAKLAAARAVADDPTPPADFIDLLGAILAGGEQQRPWADAAAQALVGYRRNEVAQAYLRRTATETNQPPVARVAATRALGRVIEVESVETLLQLLGTPNERRDVRDAAGDALVEMTGQRDNGRDVRKWTQYWQRVVAANNFERWRAEVLEMRASRFDRLSRRHASLVTSVDTRLSAQFAAAAGDREKRTSVLLDALNAPEPDVRMIGAKLVTVAIQDREEVSPAVRGRLVAMIGDGDPRVREEVVRTLTNINYAEALTALLTQLAQERDERVKVVLANAVGAIEHPAAVPQLLELTNDPSPAVALAAVRALERVGRNLAADNPARAAEVAARLRALVAPRAGALRNAGPPPSEELRIAAIDALAALKDKEMLEPARRLLAEPSPALRQATLRMLGELGNPDAGDPIADVLRSERDPAMRQLALDALGKVGGLLYAETLYAYMQKTEPDAAVREKAWQTFRAALPRATDDQLASAHTMFKVDPERHVHVARTMADRFLKRNELDQWAMWQQNTADDLMSTKLPDPPGPQPAEAAGYYESALNYWLQVKGPPLAIEELTSKTLKARLQASQWAQAGAFAQNAINRDNKAAPEVGAVIKNYVDELRSRDVRAALQLIEVALKMNPPLEKRHLDDLRQIRDQINNGTNSINSINSTADGNGTTPPQ